MLLFARRINRPIALSVLLCALLSACQQPESKVKTPGVIEFPAGGTTAVTVNGEAIPQALVEAYARQRKFDPNDPAQMQQATDKLVEFVSIAQAGRAAGALDSPEYALDRLKAAAGTYVTQLAEQPPPTEAELEAAYNQELALTGPNEYQVLHLMLNRADRAAEAETLLAAGQPFGDLVASFKNTDGVVEARDLGWLKPTQLPEPLRAPLIALNTPGQFTAKSVVYDGTWHLLQVQQIRPFVAPAFNDVRPAIEASFKQARAQKAISEIKAKATISE